jgi:N-acetylglucosamine-6-phosphate deacetylase
MVHNGYLHIDGRLIRFANCYLIEPDSGDLTTCTASLWVDRLLRTIARVVLDDPSAVNRFVSDSGQDPSIREEALAAAPTIDLQGQVLAPGLIDIQINGAYGIDFSHWPGEEEDYVSKVETVSTRLAETGVTAYLPTVIVSGHAWTD